MFYKYTSRHHIDIVGIGVVGIAVVGTAAFGIAVAFQTS